MLLAGIAVPDDLVLELAHSIADDKLTGRLIAAYGLGAESVTLTLGERRTVLAALDDPPSGLEQLRTVLREQHAWRVTHGI